MAQSGFAPKLILLFSAHGSLRLVASLVAQFVAHSSS
jgi:hypothetical protein